VVTGDQHANQIASSAGRFGKAFFDVSHRKHNGKIFDLQARAGDAVKRAKSRHDIRTARR
jgi:hypothetical protein